MACCGGKPASRRTSKSGKRNLASNKKNQNQQKTVKAPEKEKE